MQSTQKKGTLLIILAAVFWSINSPLVKSLTLDPLTISGMRALLAGLALLPFVRPGRIKFDRFFLLFCVVFSVHCTCIVLALKMTSAPIAVSMQFTAPVWLFFWERKKGDPIRFSRIWPLCVLLLGIVVFMCSNAEGVTLVGNLVALSTSLLFALVTHLSKKISGDNPLGVTSLSSLFCATVVLLLAEAPLQKVFAMSGSQMLILALLGVVQTGCGYGVYYIGLRYTSGKTAAMISPLEMVLGPLWVAFFLHQPPVTIELVAFAIVIAGILGEVIVSSREAAPLSPAHSDSAPQESVAALDKGPADGVQ